MPQLLVDEYLELTDTYRKKYGVKTIVWMQTGSFYEVYSYVEECEQIRVSRDILQIRVTRKGGSEANNKDPAWMAGFPDHSYKRFEKRLLSENYTIVYVDQVKRDPIERAVTRIVSPGCMLDSDNDTNESILVSALIECEDDDYYVYFSIYDANRGDIRVVSVSQSPGLSLLQAYENAPNSLRFIEQTK